MNLHDRRRTKNSFRQEQLRKRYHYLYNHRIIANESFLSKIQIVKLNCVGVQVFKIIHLEAIKTCLLGKRVWTWGTCEYKRVWCAGVLTAPSLIPPSAIGLLTYRLNRPGERESLYHSETRICNQLVPAVNSCRTEWLTI